MQYTQTTIIINGKIVTDTTTTTNDNDTTKNDEQNESVNFFTFAVDDNNSTQKPQKKDFLRELNGNYYFGLFGDIHRIDYNCPFTRAFMWFEFFFYGGICVMLLIIVVGFCSFVLSLIVAFLLSFIF
ncbi:MAG: hypothetical protein LBL39_02215 [Planctomycetaceae bacterium]|jgi:hypothetical protein|nr:hypothetical protein [Planctomycetaceae bacterium]